MVEYIKICEDSAYSLSNTDLTLITQDQVPNGSNLTIVSPSITVTANSEILPDILSGGLLDIIIEDNFGNPISLSVVGNIITIEPEWDSELLDNVASVNITVTTTDSQDILVDYGDGTIAQVNSGVLDSHAYSPNYSGPIRYRPLDGDLTKISSVVIT